MNSYIRPRVTNRKQETIRIGDGKIEKLCRKSKRKSHI